MFFFLAVDDQNVNYDGGAWASFVPEKYRIILRSELVRRHSEAWNGRDADAISRACLGDEAVCLSGNGRGRAMSPGMHFRNWLLAKDITKRLLASGPSVRIAVALDLQNVHADGYGEERESRLQLLEELVTEEGLDQSLSELREQAFSTSSTSHRYLDVLCFLADHREAIAEGRVLPLLCSEQVRPDFRKDRLKAAGPSPELGAISEEVRDIIAFCFGKKSPGGFVFRPGQYWDETSNPTDLLENFARLRRIDGLDWQEWRQLKRRDVAGSSDVEPHPHHLPGGGDVTRPGEGEKLWHALTKAQANLLSSCGFATAATLDDDAGHTNRTIDWRPTARALLQVDCKAKRKTHEEERGEEDGRRNFDRFSAVHDLSWLLAAWADEWKKDAVVTLAIPSAIDFLWFNADSLLKALGGFLNNGKAHGVKYSIAFDFVGDSSPGTTPGQSGLLVGVREMPASPRDWVLCYKNAEGGSPKYLFNSVFPASSAEAAGRVRRGKDGTADVLRSLSRAGVAWISHVGHSWDEDAAKRVLKGLLLLNDPESSDLCDNDDEPIGWRRTRSLSATHTGRSLALFSLFVPGETFENAYRRDSELDYCVADPTDVLVQAESLKLCGFGDVLPESGRALVTVAGSAELPSERALDEGRADRLKALAADVLVIHSVLGADVGEQITRRLAHRQLRVVTMPTIPDDVDLANVHVFVLHYNNDKDRERLAGSNAIAGRDVGLVSSVGARPGHGTAFSEECGSDCRIYVAECPLENAEHYLNLSWEAAVDTWRPGEPFHFEALFPPPNISASELLSPFATLGILLKGYMAMREPDTLAGELSGLPEDQKRLILESARRVQAGGLLSNPREWFRECYEGIGEEGEGEWKVGEDCFLDKNGSLWCFAAPFDARLRAFEEQTVKRGDMDCDLLIELLGGPGLIANLPRGAGWRAPHIGRQLMRLCEAISSCAQDPETKGFAIPLAELPDVVQDAHEALCQALAAVGEEK